MYQSNISVFREVCVNGLTMFEWFRVATPEEVPEYGHIVPEMLLTASELESMLWVE